MLGASVYVVPFMIHRSVPGIGPYVLPAFMFAALPALLAACAYAMLSSAMPRAGGSYIYASRGLHPYLGFVASFSQWFGLSIVIGVIAYIIVPFIRDVAISAGYVSLSNALEVGWIRVSIALGLIWMFVLINMRGLRSYQRVLVPMMFLMFILGGIVIAAGLYFDQTDFMASLTSPQAHQESYATSEFDAFTFIAAASLLFSSFIGFDSIAQAGGEARHPQRTLPRAILLAILVVGLFYFLFTASVYHTVPWQYVAEEAQHKDITAPGLLSSVLPPGLGIAILAGAAIALINDLPAMLLSVSRLVFAWAEDGIFPKSLAQVHPRRHTPIAALILVGIMASIGTLGSHFAGDFFLGIDIMVTSMLVNFLLMCVTVLQIRHVNPDLHSRITIFSKRSAQVFIGGTGVVLLMLFLITHTYKDLTAEVSHWYFRSTWIWLLVLAFASFLFWVRWSRIKSSGIDMNQYKRLPKEEN
ncbi:MAG: APC family permease [Saprospiraceae bacterium]|nr:APC family permease [Saprospiraceae bacterium]